MAKKNIFLISLISVALSNICIAGKKTTLIPPEISPQQITSIMTRVADWQLANPSKHATTDWTHGALFAGMTAWAQMAGNEKYYDALMGFGEKNQWKPHERKRNPNVYHADDHAVAQMYIEMYKKYKDPKMIKPIRELFDYILANQPNTPLTHDNSQHKKRYNWCDALFMAPPVWAKLARITGEQKYLDYMNKEWWATTDYLFDIVENLYFRDDRYFQKREANGKKVFWSRGNGWVFGGLVKVLEELPYDYPDRSRYENIYKKMAAKIINIQLPEGMWHSSLLDPVTFSTKEASGTGFYCYGLAWGINHGLLDRNKYLPAVIKAWTGLVNCVHPDGMLGNVQPIGADPRKVRADQTEIYGVGAFLLAGSEVYKIAMLNGKEVKKISITNPALIFREDETISVDFKEIKKSIKDITKSNAAVFEFKTNSFLITQIVESGKSSELLFQGYFAPGEKRCFWITKTTSASANKTNGIATCRFVPERRDDFAWENDKVGFRMYGTALEDETITCGIDTFGKSVTYPIMEKMLTTKGFNYHKDNGEGGDFYKVGNTLGCGGAAPFINDKICLPPKNYKNHQILANGPIRAVFRLDYPIENWKAGCGNVLISLDKGSNLSKIEWRYMLKKELPIALGIVLRDSNNKFTETGNIIGYWLKADGKNNGNIGCGVVAPKELKAEILEADGHLLLKTKFEKGKNFVYYAGSCWDKNEEFSSFDKWKKYLVDFKVRVDNPLRVRISQ